MNKAEFINQTVQEMQVLEGTAFEIMCEPLMNILAGLEMLHTGVNLEQKAVNRSVDYQSPDGFMGGQCGTDKDYFSNKQMSKPFGDIDATLKNLPNCKKLFLLTNRVADGEDLANFASKLSTYKALDVVVLKSGKDVAELIYDHLDSPDFDIVWRTLPKTYKLRAYYPYRNAIPPLRDNNVSRLGEEGKIISLFRKTDVLQIYGISGMGKTEIAKRVISKINSGFESVKWIDGESVGSAITDVDIFNYKGGLNLETYLHTTKGLVVVDNLNRGVEAFVEQFRNNNRNGSNCIITSLYQATKVESYQLDKMSDEEAHAFILKCRIQPTKDEMKIILNAVCGYPLAISIMSNNVENGIYSWKQFASDVSSILELQDDELRERLMNRIIGSIYSIYNEPLDFIAALGKPAVCVDLLEENFKFPIIGALKKYAILQPNGRYSYYVHQMIIDAVKGLSKGCPTLAEKIFAFIRKHNNDKPASYFIFLSNNADYVENLYEQSDEDGKKIILYAKIQSTDRYDRADEIIPEIDGLLGKGKDKDYDTFLTIEKGELELSKIDKKKDEERYKAKATEIITCLKKELDKTSDEGVRVTIYHHIGKLYEWMDVFDKAEDTLRTVLTRNKDSYQTRLQIARLFHRQRNFDNVKEEVKYILESDDKNIPLTAILGIYDLIGEYSLNDMREKYVKGDIDNFNMLMLMSIVAFSDQTIGVLGRLANYLEYYAPDAYKSLCNALPETPNFNHSPRSMFNYALVRTFEYKMMQDKTTEKAKEVYQIALEYYKKADIKNDFNRKRQMDLYIFSSHFDEAIKFSKTFNDPNEPYMLFDLAKAYRETNKLDEAVKAIDKALEPNIKVKDDFKSAFLNEKAEILYAQGDNSCIHTLEEANKIRREPLKEWDEKLSEWRKYFDAS